MNTFLTFFPCIDTFLQINDQINTVLNRYEAFKKGDYVTSSNPIPAELSSGATQNLSLIDLDDSASSSSNPVSLGLGPDDLVGLFTTPPAPSNRPTPVIPAGPPMGGRPPMQPYASPMPSNGNGYGMSMLMGGAPGMSRPTISPPSLSATPPASIMLPGTPGANTSTPNYFGGNGYTARGPVAKGGGMGMGASASSSSTLPVMQPQQPYPPSANAAAPPQTQNKDPFADLAGLF